MKFFGGPELWLPCHWPECLACKLSGCFNCTYMQAAWLVKWNQVNDLHMHLAVIGIGTSAMQLNANRTHTYSEFIPKCITLMMEGVEMFHWTVLYFIELYFIELHTITHPRRWVLMHIHSTIFRRCLAHDDPEACLILVELLVVMFIMKHAYSTLHTILCVQTRKSRSINTSKKCAGKAMGWNVQFLVLSRPQ